MWKKLILAFILLILLLVAGAFFFLHESKPGGEAGPEADVLARKMMQAVNHKQWDSTNVISWIFRDRHELLWDKKRHLTRVRWDNKEVFVDINRKSGIAYQNGKQLSGEEAAELVQDAWAYWANDSFWLNPVAKLFDDGATRELVKLKNGETGVMVTYGKGGVTPGDSYLWVADENGLPKSWKMWVKIIPFGGFETSWEEWISLPKGAKISTYHRSKIADIYLTEVKAADSVVDLEGNDPFERLLQQSF